jgi:ABC-type nitrate/sulfonate/bicarbonate transport system substrate-binding protein
MSLRRGRTPVLLTLLATAVLALSACGGSSDSGTASSGNGGNLGSVKIILGGQVVTWAPAYVAVCDGDFKKHGLDVDLTVSAQGTTSAIAGLVSGDAISAMTGAPAAVSPVRQGAPVQMLFNASIGYGVQVVASNDLLARKHITDSTPLAQRIQALKGETVAILNPGDSIDQLLRYVLPKYGVNIKSITEIALNNYSSMFAAMKVKKISVLAGSPPNGNQAESQGIGKILFSGNQIPGLTNYPYLVGSVNTRELQSNPAQVKALVAGLSDAMKSLRANPDSGKACLRKQFPDLDEKTFDSAYDFAVKSVPASPLITPAIFKSLTDFAQTSGDPVGVTYDKAVASDIVKQALAGK